MPPEAKIFLVEDDEASRGYIRDVLESGGHRVVAEAKSLKEALASVAAVRDLRVQVAVLDGNLTPGDSSCDDGRKLAAALRAGVPGIRILANSNSENADYGDAVVDQGAERLLEEIISKVNGL